LDVWTLSRQTVVGQRSKVTLLMDTFTVTSHTRRGTRLTWFFHGLNLTSMIKRYMP